MTVWFTGLSGAGKSTLCAALADSLMAQGVDVQVLDGDAMRKTLCHDLGFSQRDRTESLCRLVGAAQMLLQDGIVVLVAAISPYRKLRRILHKALEPCLEVYVNAPLPVCEVRDPKGLYRKARAGLIADFTGISHPYEEPLEADIECRTDTESVERSCQKVLAAVESYLEAFRTLAADCNA